MKTLLCIGLMSAACAHAGALAVATHGSLHITLTDEPCALVKQVTNLPKRVIWDDGTRKIEGCFGVIGPVVIAYFATKTVAAIPIEAFEPVESL